MTTLAPITTVPRAPDDESVDTRSPRVLHVTKAPAERAFLGLTRTSALIVLTAFATVYSEPLKS